METASFGYSYLGAQEISPQMQAKVDKEIKEIVDKCYSQAIGLLKREKKVLDKLAARLVEKETLASEEIKNLLGKKK